jgi:ankyrin repeat protein
MDDFHKAVKEANVAKVKKLLGAGVSSRVKDMVQSVDPDGTTALHWAVDSGSVEIVDLLLKNGANVNAKYEKSGFITPLHLAATGGDIKIVQQLLSAGADLGAKYYYMDETPLHLAAKNGHANVVKLLLEKGADINAVLQNGSTALHLAGSPGVVAVLLSFGANVNSKRRTDNATPLYFAALNGKKEIVAFLLKNGADPTIMTTGPDGETPLHAAIVNGHLEIVPQLLTKRGMEMKDVKGATPLFAAVENGQQKILELLLARGANIHTQNKEGITPLIAAIKRGDKEMVQFLLNKGVKMDAITHYGETALYFAAVLGSDSTLPKETAAPYIEIVKLLLEKGANPLITMGSKNKSIYAIAKEGKDFSGAINQLILNRVAVRKHGGGKTRRHRPRGRTTQRSR